jgi:hypothetical protein
VSQNCCPTTIFSKVLWIVTFYIVNVQEQIVNVQEQIVNVQEQMAAQ